jgi:prepilin-type N-terminal cleavage/methylation domain-containing protein
VRTAFTLVELIVVIAVIAMLMALTFPTARMARESGAEAVCQSNLHQMAVMLRTYCGDHDNQFPNLNYIYHSRESFGRPTPGESSSPAVDTAAYPASCRWHDHRIGPASSLMHEHKELQGDLIPYIGNPRVLLCKTAIRAYLERGCNQDSNDARRSQPTRLAPRTRHAGSTGPRRHGSNTTTMLEPDEPLRLIPQYAYTMNGNLHRTLSTGIAAGSLGGEVNPKTVRATTICRETQVTRSPSDVFAFGEENSWTINRKSRWPACYNLSGPWGGTQDGTADGPSVTKTQDKGMPVFKLTGSINLGSLDIMPSYTTWDSSAEHPYASRVLPETDVGDAFATYHRPPGGDLNKGHSYVVMLDGHVRKVTVSDQLRRSRQDPNFAPSRLGPGGNLHLAWPLDIPPLGGWENQ